MFVRNHMLKKEKLTTVSLNENIGSVLEKIAERDFLSLPVVEGDTFHGIIMKETIYRHFFEQDCKDKSEYLLKTKVEDIYRKEYQSICESDKIEKASYLLQGLRTPFLPVFNTQNKFVGILTHFSIFNAFSEVFGVDNGTRIIVNMFDLPGQIARLTEVIRKEDANIINLAVVDAKVMDIMKVVLRVDTEDPDGLVEKIQLAGFKIGEVIK